VNPNDLPMNASPDVEVDAAADAAAFESSSGDSLLTPLLRGDVQAARSGRSADANQGVAIQGVVIGELLAIADDGATPLVRFDGQPGTAAVAARSSVDLHGPHIGASVVLIFERGDPTRPVIIGLLKERAGWPQADQPAQVEVDADGQRMIVSAREQLVMRCGKASITLTKAGKVLVEGTYVLSKSSGVNRVKGGSVQLN
jgi:Domain of unknown function (DUF6484)